MKILVTAGGTSEKIDDVRHITNHSTGRLGKEIAEQFAQLPGTEVLYLCGIHAVRPKMENIQIIPVTSVRHLERTVKKILTTETIEAVIHSMAVSDYQVAALVDTDQWIHSLSTQLVNQENVAEIEKIIAKNSTQHTAASVTAEKKISSKTENLTLFLEQSPKVISKIKKWQPETHLFGFKLLVGVTTAELKKVAFTLLQKNQCDFVFANDLETITQDTHPGILIDKAGNTYPCTTKKEIAATIVAQFLHVKEGS